MALSRAARVACEGVGLAAGFVWFFLFPDPVGMRLGGFFVLITGPFGYLQLRDAESFDFEGARADVGHAGLVARLAGVVLATFAFVVGSTALLADAIAAVHGEPYAGDVAAFVVPLYGTVLGATLGFTVPSNVVGWVEQQRAAEQDHTGRPLRAILAVAASAGAVALYAVLSGIAHEYAVPGWATVGRDYVVPLALAVALAAGPANAFPYVIATRRPVPVADTLRTVGLSVGVSALVALLALAPVAYVLVNTDDGALQFALGLLAVFVVLPASIYAGPALELRLR